MLDSIGIGTRFTAIQNLFAYAGKIGVLKKVLALRNWLFTRLDIYSFARFIHIQTYVIYSASGSLLGDTCLTACTLPQ